MREKIKALIEKFVEDYKRKGKAKTDWQKPIVAFAKANDPLFFPIKESS